MKVLVVGAGATGGLFGGLLAQAGRDVTFLVREARAAQLREHGLRIQSPRGDLLVAPQLVEARELTTHFDVVLLGIKAYALEGAIEDFVPAVGPQTMIVPMLNGMRHIDLLIQRFGEAPVLGGVCIVASVLEADGTIAQLNEMQELIYGERSGERTPRIRALDSTMQGAGFAARLSDNIVQAMWEKWVFLASLAASTCLLGGSVGTIVAAGGTPVINGIFDECVSVARAAGYPPAQAYVNATRERLTQTGSPLTASMYRDRQQQRPVEADAILGDLVARAGTFGLDVPLLRAAYVQLDVYQRGRTTHA